MTDKFILNLIPYAASLGISLGLLFYVWTWRKARSATAFFWYASGQTLYMVGTILETVSPSLNMKLFWESYQGVVGSLAIIAFPVFIIQYTEFDLKNYKRLFALTLIFPFLFSILSLTEGYHDLIYVNPRLINRGFFPALIYDYSPVFIIYTIYIYFIFLTGCLILVRKMMQPHSLYRRQALVILAGLTLPMIGSAFSLLDIFIASQRDASPFTIAIGNLLLTWGLFRFRIFKVTPIARDNVFEALVDPVVILDKKNNVVDINTSMLDLLDKRADEVIGVSAKAVFEDFPIPIKMYTDVSYARAETSFEINGKHIYYELTIWPLYNSKKEMTGRIYISHDITAMKELESELRKLNTKLEDRVQERTKELAEAYESMLEGFARALELRDKETEGHSRRVTENTLKMAVRMGLKEDFIEDIRSGAILHDIGKISIPDEILHKKGKLTPEERKVIEQHPDTAYKLLSRIPFLNRSLEIPYCHHEKWDGTGYPRGLKGKDIPLSARIFAVADVWDALSNDRPYNTAWPREKIVEYFKEQSGKHFDPVITSLFLSMVEKGEI
ncbi:MAG TPA: histidine kinase N-terminal 7TM domain-containing protein [Anaerolineales bacterium]|nr:histidine kinase N-terminal 7TM domain-containing protein [Anaerolineales bacterium]